MNKEIFNNYQTRIEQRGGVANLPEGHQKAYGIIGKASANFTNYEQLQQMLKNETIAKLVKEHLAYLDSTEKKPDNLIDDFKKSGKLIVASMPKPEPEPIPNPPDDEDHETYMKRIAATYDKIRAFARDLMQEGEKYTGETYDVLWGAGNDLKDAANEEDYDLADSVAETMMDFVGDIYNRKAYDFYTKMYLKLAVFFEFTPVPIPAFKHADENFDVKPKKVEKTPVVKKAKVTPTNSPTDSPTAKKKAAKPAKTAVKKAAPGKTKKAAPTKPAIKFLATWVQKPVGYDIAAFKTAYSLANKPDKDRTLRAYRTIMKNNELKRYSSSSHKDLLNKLFNDWYDAISRKSSLQLPDVRYNELEAILDSYHISPSTRILKAFWGMVGNRPTKDSVKRMLKQAVRVAEKDKNFDRIKMVRTALENYLEGSGVLTAPKAQLQGIGSALSGLGVAVTYGTLDEEPEGK